MFFLKENLFPIFLISILLIILAYVTNITSIPDNIILFKEDEISIQTIAGVKVEEINNNQIIQTSTKLKSNIDSNLRRI